MDASLYFAPLDHWALAQVIGGDLFSRSRGPLETQHAAADILDAFIREALSGESGLLTGAVARYSEIKGGPIERSASAAGASTTLGASRSRDRFLNGIKRRVPCGRA